MERHLMEQTKVLLCKFILLIKPLLFSNNRLIFKKNNREVALNLCMFCWLYSIVTQSLMKSPLNMNYPHLPLLHQTYFVLENTSARITYKRTNRQS